MRILLVTRYKPDFVNHILPFVKEQGDALERAGVSVDYFLIEGNGLGAYFKCIRALKRKISVFAPDVIHAHYGLSAIPAVSQGRVPVVITFHNGETLGWEQNFLSSLASLRAKHVIYVAQHIYDKVFFKKKDRHSIMPCGVNLDELGVIPYAEARAALGLDDSKKHVLFGGAFSNLRKNYPLLEAAVKVIGNEQIAVHEMKGLTRQQATEFMCACDVFALPSKSEGSPQALKEAMACGCPIVATDIADVRHLLGDVAGHYICDFTPESVAAQLQKALAFDGRTEGRKRIVELGLTNDKVAEKLIEIYQSVI